MSELKKIQDRIDEYIRGTMSISDRIIFEEELRQNAELRQEVEVQTIISDAVQAVHLKQLLQQIEVDMAPDKDEYPAAVVSDEDRRRVVSISPNVFWRHFLYWASAAAAVAIIFFSANSWRQTQRFKGIGNEYYAALVEPFARDGNEIDNLIASSYALIGAGEFDAATADLNEARKKITDSLVMPIIDEESEYQHQILQEQLYDVEWYDAILLMKRGKYLKAKGILRSIASSDSPYADNAKTILE